MSNISKDLNEHLYWEFSSKLLSLEFECLVAEVVKKNDLRMLQKMVKKKCLSDSKKVEAEQAIELLTKESLVAMQPHVREFCELVQKLMHIPDCVAVENDMPANSYTKAEVKRIVEEERALRAKVLKAKITIHFFTEKLKYLRSLRDKVKEVTVGSSDAQRALNLLNEMDLKHSSESRN